MLFFLRSKTCLTNFLWPFLSSPKDCQLLPPWLKTNLLRWSDADQAPAGSRIFNPRISGMGFCKIPGFFGTGLAWNFVPGIYQKRTESLRISLSAHEFGQFHTFWRTYLFANTLDRQRSYPSHPVTSSKSKGVFSVAGKPKKILPRTRESRCLRYCQMQPWSV